MLAAADSAAHKKFSLARGGREARGGPHPPRSALLAADTVAELRPCARHSGGPTAGACRGQRRKKGRGVPAEQQRDAVMQCKLVYKLSVGSGLGDGQVGQCVNAKYNTQQAKAK